MTRVYFLCACMFYVGTWMIALNGCGGDGGDTADASVLPDAASEPRQITCEHDGDVWLCVRDQCSRDMQSEIVEAMGDDETESKTLYKATTFEGDVTIIAECGSNVVFNSPEDNDTTTLTGTAGVGT